MWCGLCSVELVEVEFEKRRQPLRHFVSFSFIEFSSEAIAWFFVLNFFLLIIVFLLLVINSRVNHSEAEFIVIEVVTFEFEMYCTSVSYSVVGLKCIIAGRRNRIHVTTYTIFRIE